MNVVRVKRLVSRGLLRFVAIFTVVSTFHFDWNVTQIYNPTWPLHAKYHNGQTMMMVFLQLLMGTLSATRAPKSEEVQVMIVVMGITGNIGGAKDSK